MSASEKLKALEQATELSALPSPFNVIGNHGQWASLAEPYLALRFALPQIVAVVEALQRTNQHLDGYIGYESHELIGMNAAALAALEEALS
jgi:hypothetical protein